MREDWILYPDMKAVELPGDAGTAFKEVMAKIRGATYVPVLLCGKREVPEGVNYMFYCKQTLDTFAPEGSLIQMIIHKPYRGEAVVVGIKRLL